VGVNGGLPRDFAVGDKAGKARAFTPENYRLCVGDVAPSRKQFAVGLSRHGRPPQPPKSHLQLLHALARARNFQ
jgi:hypothetical protein